VTARDLTGTGIIRALGGFRPAMRQALAARAGALAAAIAAREPAATVTATDRGEAEIVVTASAPGLFAREFGGRDAVADPVIDAAISDIAERTR
jgi:hypothetical protein